MSFGNWSRSAASIFIITPFIAGCGDEGPECNPGEPGESIVAPDQMHIARIHETFCGAPGASDAWVVSIRNKSADASQEQEVFITFDYRPTFQWVDNKHLVIELTGVSDINKSDRQADGIVINYILRSTITEDSIVAKLKDEQHRYSNMFPKDQSVLFNANARKRYEAFLKWAKDYANLTDSRH